MKNLLLLAVLVALVSCKSLYVKVDKDAVHHIDCVNNNVCKTLKGKVVLYAIFVDSKHTNIWTEYDIKSTLDSIQLALNWLEGQADSAGVQLDLVLDYHKNKKTIPIAQNFQRKTLSNTLFFTNGIKNVDRWADRIARDALKPYGPDESEITKTKIKPKDRENLLARLRNIHGTDNVGLLYFINNFYKDEISVVLHSHADDSPEYGIVSYKTPGVIAHEFMHLFGAIDLYLSPFDKKRQARKRKAFAMKEFPNEIMAFPHRRLNTLDISPFTRYLIGWEYELNNHYKEMLIGKKIRVAKY